VENIEVEVAEAGGEEKEKTKIDDKETEVDEADADKGKKGKEDDVEE
jgi:hypothetical protein